MASSAGNVNPAGSAADGRSLVLAAVDIVELVGRTVKLTRRGRNYVGLCPFHQEKTGSFSVNPEERFFHCFGCKASGNAVDFVMKRDRIGFKEALVLLAEEYNVQLPRFGGMRQDKGERQLLLDAHSAAASLFEKLLTHDAIGKPARDYLASRGFDRESVKRFQIGYVPDGWDTLLRSPEMRKFPPPVLALAGLVKARDGGNGFYDTFRNRLIFPIRDENGRVIAFGGRVMPGSKDPAKYLNSPETPLFSKSRSVFGLDLARQRIVETRTVAVVEGYTDVVMAHQYGASNVVSILGTAMTEQHVGILRRFADRIVLLFDADSAGDTAVNRAVELFLTQPVEIAIASMPEGVDPDEYLLANGVAGFEQVLKNAQDVLAYKWKQLTRDFGASPELTHQQKAVEQYLEVLADARGSGPVDSIRWGAALARVSRLTDIPVDELNRRFRMPRARAARPRPVPNRAGPTDGQVRGVDDGDGTAQAPGAVEPTNSDRSVRLVTGPLTAQDRAERWILAALLAEPSRWHEVQQHVTPADFTEPTRRQLAEVYWTYQRNEGEPVFAELLGLLQDVGGEPLKQLAVELVELADASPFVEREAADSVQFILWTHRQREYQRSHAAALRQAREAGDDQAEAEHLRRLMEKARLASERNKNL